MTDRASGVRNLRAMFEGQNAASSPEPRGRSPAGSAASGDLPNRPTSKVRASFVSVEPSGHAAKDLGVTKGTPSNSVSAHRRESFSVSEDLGDDVPADLKKVVSEEKEERRKSAAIIETVPEQAVETRESSVDPPPIRETEDEMPNLGSIMKGSDFPEPTADGTDADKAAEQTASTPTTQEKADEKAGATSLEQEPAENPDKVVTGAQEEVALKPADPTSESAVSGGDALPPPTEDLHHIDTAATAPGTPKSSDSKTKANGTPATNGKSMAKKPANISTAKASASKAPPSKSPLPPARKSPSATRAPKTPTTPKATPASSAAKSAPAKSQAKAAPPKESTKAPATTKAPASKPSRSSMRPSTATSGTTASATAKAKTPVTETKKPAPAKSTTPAPAPKDGTSTSPGGFKKPRPRSPTRPVRLPSHLTAPTTASAAKHGEEATQKGTTRPAAAPRPASKAAPAPRAQSSRTSLAPSTAPATKRPESRASTQGASGEGFLARMMRPTASSASKTHEKPASPPRRGASVKSTSKPKEGVPTKGKKKVEQAATKAKETVTNGSHDQSNVEENVQAESVAEPAVETVSESKTDATIESNPPSEAPTEQPAKDPVIDTPEPSGTDVQTSHQESHEVH